MNASWEGLSAQEQQGKITNDLMSGNWMDLIQPATVRWLNNRPVELIYHGPSLAGPYAYGSFQHMKQCGYASPQVRTSAKLYNEVALSQRLTT